MANPQNKVKFGLKRLHFAAYTGDTACEKPWENPGAKSVSVSAADSSTFTIEADDNPSFFSKGGGGGKELTIEATRFVRDFYVKFCGQEVETETGALVEGPDDVFKPFAVGFEMTGDAGKIRVWVLHGTATVPTYSAKTGNNEDTDSTTVTASSVKCADGKTHTMVTFEPGDAGYETAFDKVPFMDAPVAP